MDISLVGLCRTNKNMKISICGPTNLQLRINKWIKIHPHLLFPEQSSVVCAQTPRSREINRTYLDRNR